MPVQQGIGYQDDLKVHLHETAGTKWFPQLQSGTYYLGGREHYMYASEGSEDFAVPAGFGTINLTTTADLLTATKHGPIRLLGESLEYIRSTNCLVCYEPLTFSGTGTIMTATVPGTLVMLTDANGTNMSSVPASGLLIDRSYYYLDETTIYIQRSINDPDRAETLYATYLRDTPGFLQEEILIADHNGLFRTTLPRVMFGASGTAFDPIIYIIGTGTVAASAVVDNIIYPATAVAAGTTAAVKYYVNKSFLAGISGDALTIQTLSETTDNATLFWENAFSYSFYDAGTLPSTGTSYVQLNPLFTGIGSGFIYLDQPRHPAENLSELKIFAAPLRVASGLRQVLRINVLALDADENPLPHIPITCVLESQTGTKYTTKPLGSGKTNYLGEARFSFTALPLMHGTYTIGATGISASGSVISASTLVEFCDPMILSDAVDAGKVFLALNKNKDALGYRDLYVYLTNQAGIPLLQDLDVLVWCDTGYFIPAFTISASGTLQNSKSILLNFASASAVTGLRVATCKYFGTEEDTIYAMPQDGNDVAQYKFVSTPLEVSNA